MAGGGGSAASDYAARAAAEARAATTAHGRALEMQRRQQAYQRSIELGRQGYQRQLAEWQSAQEQRHAEYMQRKQQAFAKWQSEMTAWREAKLLRERLERERQLGISELLQGRQERYAQMMPQDAIRATLFALGHGQGAEGFRTRAKHLKTTLAPLAGAKETAWQQQHALNVLLGKKDVGTTIGKYGITGLGPAGKAARAWQQKGADARKLLTSAFGVGSTLAGETPGMGQERLQELMTEVTPTGAFE